MPTPDISIDVRNLTKRYGSLLAVDHINFKVMRGEIYSLLGPNGAGKTTTISMLATLRMPTEGDALVEGYSVVRERTKVRKVIGVVPQDLTADDELTGLDNVLLMARLHGYSGKEAEERAWEAIKFMELEDAAKRRVMYYSGGMRRRLEIAMSIVHNPKVVFLDEPTVGLDVQSRRHIWDLVRELKKEGITVILTTHYMEEAEELSDRVAIIDHGHIVAEGTPEDLKAKVKGDRIYVKLKSDAETTKAIEALSKDFNDVKEMDGYVVIKVESSADAMPQLIKLLSNFDVTELRVVRPNLEEVFLELTGHGLREEESFDAFKFRRLMRAVRS
ncbi:MAG: ATP-binding cassette domain-containing protein [Acidilobus sp.]|jgi:ABC-2 type transport system ATP-binding protein